MTLKVEYIKLNVDGLLDLERMSKEFQIPKIDLINYHNTYCEMSEILPLHLPKYVPFIYISKENFERRNLQLLQSNTLKYPSHKASKNYGVVIKNAGFDLQIHFEISVKREGNLVELSKGKNYINHKEVENLIEQLYETAEQTMYPLKMSVESNGHFSKIENEKEISERWRTISLPKLKEYYVGETSDMLITKMDRFFQDMNSKKDRFERSILHRILFFPVYQTYVNYTKEDNIEFYFSKIQRYVNYDIQYFLNKEYIRGTKIALQIKGKEKEIHLNDKTEKGAIDFIYKFHKDTHELFSIEGFVSTFQQGKELKVEFQMFEI